MSTNDATEPPADKPLWLPADVDPASLPTGLRQAFKEIVNPAYKELVLEAPTALQRTVGLSYMHLIWLALVEQVALGKYLWHKPRPESIDTYQQISRGHLQLVGAKDKLAKFLLQAQHLHQKYGI
jgi:hypothetical protein